MRQKTADLSTAKPDEGSLELTENIIRNRAYQFYEERARIHQRTPNVSGSTWVETLL
jgi:hypothetical protein